MPPFIGGFDRTSPVPPTADSSEIPSTPSAADSDEIPLAPFATGSDEIPPAEDTQSDADDTQPAFSPVPAGFKAYNNTSLGLRFSYPEEWLLLDTALVNQPDVLAATSARMGIDVETLSAMVEQVAVIIYNMDESRDGFTPNLNVVLQNVPGLTEDGFATDDMAKATEITTTQQFSFMFSDFVFTEKPAVKELGGRKMISFAADCTAGEVSTSVYQAIIADAGKMFNIGYSTMYGSLDDETMAVVDQILSTIEID
ncbi:MAG: hypothetical protein LBH86_01770 [Oscillospiraceae bacterium]|nr:hypothetical protein [Oscillospiraceae bacterium]